jgi:hypothetical protein
MTQNMTPEERPMYRKILIGGVTAAAIVGAGGTALAVSGSDATTSGNPITAAAKQAPAKGKAERRLLRRLAHAQIVTKGKDGFVTHDLIKGSVTAVSATSITVQAADKTSETFVVDKYTKVRVRTAGKGAASSIDKVAVGDQVMVAGSGTSTFTAKHVVDVKK